MILDIEYDVGQKSRSKSRSEACRNAESKQIEKQVEKQDWEGQALFAHDDKISV